MSASKEEIFTSINAYFKTGQRRDWYVGIAADPKQRLFKDHNVTEGSGSYIALEASSTAEAREIEQTYLDAGFDGGAGGGDNNTNWVYAYLKVPGTVR